jgi:hypothetical protein
VTCIVGAIGGRRVWLGADARLSDEGAYEITATGKLWRAGGYLLGACGNSAWYALLRRVELPRVAAEGYMLRGWAEDLLASARALGLDMPPGEDGAADGAALVAGAGLLWYVDSDLECYRVPREIAIGSGGEVARGALYAAKGHTRRRVGLALEAAASVRADVGPPFTIASV